MALLTVSHVSKSFPGLPVLHDVSFEVAAGETLCVLGPSGCGKTTLLRIIAGLDTADAGSLTFAGDDLSHLPVHRRHFGLMFQDFALFPHKDVFANVAFGLQSDRRRSSAEIRQRVAEMLALVQLAGYERRRVTELSGGEQQRVALARSLAPGPRLLMLDEPLGSLDRTLREEVMNELAAILKRVGVTALYVTHDQGEAFAVADRILVMRPDAATGGRVEQAGTPQQVYRRPATPFVARFLGFHNLLPGVILAATAQGHDATASGLPLRSLAEEPGAGLPEAANAAQQPVGAQVAPQTEGAAGAPMPSVSAQTGAALCQVQTALGPLWAGGGGQECRRDRLVTVLVRPEAARWQPASPVTGNTVAGILQAISFRGSHYLATTLHPGGVELICELPATGHGVPVPGDHVTLWLDPAAITLLPVATK